MFGDRGDLAGGKNGAHRVDDPIAVGLDRLLRINLKGVQSGDGVDGGHAVADIAGRVRADEEDSFAAARQLDGGGTRDARLPHSALPGEEDVTRGIVEELDHRDLLTFWCGQQQPEDRWESPQQDVDAP